LKKVTVASVTSTIRGVSAEVILTEEDGMKGPCVAKLHNVSTVPNSQMGRLVATLSAETISRLCAALRFSLGCD
jgi:mRNA interferase MazF